MNDLPAILMDDDSLLRTRSMPVDLERDLADARTLVDVMKAVLHDKGGRGLAAVQIGVPSRVLIIRTNPHPFHVQAFINPTRVRALNRFTTEREGCLSIPAWKWGDVERPAKCDAEWFDEEGEFHTATLTGETARIFQHEYDHLEGILQTDHYSVRDAVGKTIGQP